MTEPLLVDVESGSYRVDIGEDLFHRIGDVLEDRQSSVTKMFIITDENVRDYWLEPLQDMFDLYDIDYDQFVIPAGESSKSVQQLEEIWQDLLSKQGDRSSMVAALGGGVVGDLAGFVAATYMRGISLIHVPTSLLAQVDSCIGGKVGVNLPSAKNAVGAFYPPQHVCIDIRTLQTLPDREYRAGLSECIKYGLIMDASFLEWIESHTDDLLDRKEDALLHLVRRSVECKVSVVERDEKEAGLRQILNFGHTLGHGIEAATSYGRYLHGEAIAPGMLGSIRLSERVGKLQDQQLFDRVKDLFDRMDLPTGVTELAVDDVTPHLKHDKKAKKGEPRWVLIKSAGNVEYGHTVDSNLVIDSIHAILD